MSVKKVLITGVSGLVGSAIYQHLAQWSDRYEIYGLGRRRAISDRVFDKRKINIPDNKYMVGDIADMDFVASAVSGMDVVVHMAADPSGQGWESLHKNNIVGAYNIFEACKDAGVKRVVAASTIQVSTGNCEEEPYKAISEKRYQDVSDHITPVSAKTIGQPRNLYAASKVWAESLAQVYGYSHGMSCLCIRIGWVTGEDQPRGGRSDIWCSQHDIAELTRCCIDADPDHRFGIYYGMSNNKWCWVDMEDSTNSLGFKPEHSAEDHD